MGQSDIGPPTTIGLGGFYGPSKNVNQFEVKSIYFVGSISPKGYLLPTVVGTKRMVDKALELGFDHILIDTTGLIQGSLGKTLKEHKIELINPDLIIILQRQTECEYLIKRFRAISNQHIIVMKPFDGVRNKSPAERREYRERSLQAYFFNSKLKKLNLKDFYLLDIPLFSGYPFSEKEKNDLSQKINRKVLWAESQGDEIHLVALDSIKNFVEKPPRDDTGRRLLFAYTPSEFEDILVGLYNKVGECYSLGIMRKIDFSSQQAEIEIAEDKEEPVGIKFSRYRINQNGSVCFLPRRNPIRGET
jgi:polynucleotide 5'-hydroxyl-kinase GRC3/NOL9